MPQYYVSKAVMDDRRRTIPSVEDGWYLCASDVPALALRFGWQVPSLGNMTASRCAASSSKWIIHDGARTSDSYQLDACRGCRVKPPVYADLIERGFVTKRESSGSKAIRLFEFKNFHAYKRLKAKMKTDEENLEQKDEAKNKADLSPLTALERFSFFVVYGFQGMRSDKSITPDCLKCEMLRKLQRNSNCFNC